MVWKIYLIFGMENLLNFEEFITESIREKTLKLSPEDKNKLIQLDRKFNKVLDEYTKEHIHFANVKNIDEQVEKIIYSVNTGIDFKIELEYEESKFSDTKWIDNLKIKIGELVDEFTTLDCYLTKFYIYKLKETLQSIMFLSEYVLTRKSPEIITHPSKELYDIAKQYIKDNPYVDVHKLEEENPDFKRNKDPEYSRKRLQKIIDDLGYGWKVIIDDNMIPRMSVTSYKEFRISKRNKFSEIDLQSLEVHEIKVHTARKYYALQTGLYLFLYGLKGHNQYDEGIAIYNSLNKLKIPKPNILFYISIKILILFNIGKMNNLEIFKLVKKITKAPDDVIALAMVRAARVFSYQPDFTSSTDTDYLEGYERVKNMSENEREELIHYTIGPDQLFELDKIKEFLKVNKFKPLK